MLLHDFYAWHYALNYWYLGAPRADAQFERRCKAAGCPLYSDVPLADGELHAELLHSWEAIFDLPGSRRLQRLKGPNQPVQATFWQLNASHVSEVVEFGTEGVKEKLPLPSGFNLEVTKDAAWASNRRLSSNQG